MSTRGPKRLFSVLVLLTSGCATTGGICSDYLSQVNCIGRSREIHHGIDFRGPAGTEVISATHGTVVRTLFNECAGYIIVIRTDIVARGGDAEGPVFARYAHTEPLADLKISQEVKPGDVIGRIIPLRHTSCYASAEHTHYELRVLNAADRHIDPHQFWVNGPGQVTCFADGVVVPAGKAVAPLRCAQ
jgi:murein DD-endopeptidase MepM/ murein hydrolase activator NlpD